MNANPLRTMSLIAVVAGSLMYSQRLAAQDVDASNAGRAVKTHQASIRLTPVVKSELLSSASWFAFASDGARIVTGGHTDLAVYEASTLKRIRTIDVPAGIGSVVLSHDNQTAYATVGNCDELRWWGLGHGASEGAWKSQVIAVRCALPSSEVLASGPGKIMLVNPHTGKQKTVIETDPGTILYDAYLDSDGTLTVMENREVGDQPHWIRRIDFAKRIIRERQFKVGREEGPDLYRCGNRAVVGLNWKAIPGQDPICELEVWGGAEFNRLQAIKIPDSKYTSCGICVGEDYLCVGGRPLGDSLFEPEGYFTFVDVKSGIVLHREKFHSPVERLAFCAEKKLLAALIGDGELRIWKLEID